MSKNMRGTIFSVEQGAENSPTHLGCVQIDGVRIDLAVYPQEISRKGNPYNAIKLHYPIGSEAILKAVKVNKENN